VAAPLSVAALIQLFLSAKRATTQDGFDPCYFFSVLPDLRDCIGIAERLFEIQTEQGFFDRRQSRN
jgi:hypothetical protein